MSTSNLTRRDFLKTSADSAGAFANGGLTSRPVPKNEKVGAVEADVSRSSLISSDHCDDGSPKPQAPTAKQTSRRKPEVQSLAARRRLKFGAWSLLGTWSLELGA